MDGLISYEVLCVSCGNFSEIECMDGSLGFAHGECQHCGLIDDHEIVGQDDEDDD